jgi:hypothetical protein
VFVKLANLLAAGLPNSPLVNAPTIPFEVSPNARSAQEKTNNSAKKNEQPNFGCSSAVAEN